MAARRGPPGRAAVRALRPGACPLRASPAVPVPAMGVLLMRKPSERRLIVIGVSGSIAAYKAAEVVSALVKNGREVIVVMTRAATRFVAPLTFEALSHRPVVVDLFDSQATLGTEHISLADRAALLAVVPATADVIGRLAHGLADDMLTTTALALTVPLVIAPAMNDNMWAHPAVVENVRTLKRRGAVFIEPEQGMLACGHVGMGRLAAPERIVAELERMADQAAGGSRGPAGRRRSRRN